MWQICHRSPILATLPLHYWWHRLCSRPQHNCQNADLPLFCFCFLYQGSSKQADCDQWRACLPRPLQPKESEWRWCQLWWGEGIPIYEESNRSVIRSNILLNCISDTAPSERRTHKGPCLPPHPSSATMLLQVVQETAHWQLSPTVCLHQSYRCLTWSLQLDRHLSGTNRSVPTKKQVGSHWSLLPVMLVCVTGHVEGPMFSFHVGMVPIESKDQHQEFSKK